MTNFGDKVKFIWRVADLLCGPYKLGQYGRGILPLTVLRRLDCVLEPTKEKVLAKAAELKGGKVANMEPILNRTAKASFHNTSNRGRVALPALRKPTCHRLSDCVAGSERFAKARCLRDADVEASSPPVCLGLTIPFRSAA